MFRNVEAHVKEVRMIAAVAREMPRLLVISDGDSGRTLAQGLDDYRVERVENPSLDSLPMLLQPLPNLLLIDAGMNPESTAALCTSVRVLLGDAVPVLVIVPPNEYAIEQAYEAGADEVLVQPVLRAALRRRVEHLLAEAETRRDARLLHHLFEQSNVMKLLIEPESGIVLNANAAACQFYGYTREQLLAKSLTDLDPHPMRQGIHRAIYGTREQNAYFVFSQRMAGGETRETELYTMPVNFRGQRAVYVILHDITQRRQVEARLRESEERYHRILESSSEIVFTLSTDTTITFLSPAFERLTGYSPDDWVGHPFVPIIYFDDLPLALQVFQRVLQGEIAPPFELRFYTNDGRIGYGEVLMHPQMHNREIVGIWGAVRDITQRKLAETAEREHRALAEALRETASALNATLDRDEVLERILTHVYRVVPSDTANIMLIEDGMGRVVRTRGYAERGLLEDVYKLRFPINDTPNLRWMVETGETYLIQDVGVFEGWQHAPSTDWIRSHIGTPIRINGRVTGFLNLDSGKVNAFDEQDAERLHAFADQAATAIRNANLYDALVRQAVQLEQRVAERTAELEHERAQLFTILDSLTEGVMYDENLRVRYINRALADLTGYHIEEWKNGFDILRSERMTEDEMAQLNATIFRAVGGGTVYSTEMTMRRKDGTEFEASVTCKRVLSPQGNVVGAVTVIRDISQEKALQAQKARFVAYASHELRTPITNLKTRLYLLRRQPEQMEHHLATFESVVERMRRLVEDLLDTSRFDRGVISLQRQMVELQSLLKDVIRLQEPEAGRKQIALEASLPETPLRGYIDPERITQVLTNLVTNAINYTPAGGVVRLELSEQQDDVDGIPHITIAVVDNGIGIAPEHLQHIFQPFFRVDGRIEGTGLGLSITQQIVQLHGGEITVESEAGRGSTFHVRLPLAHNLSGALLASGRGNALQPS